MKRIQFPPNGGGDYRKNTPTTVYKSVDSLQIGKEMKKLAEKIKQQSMSNNPGSTNTPSPLEECLNENGTLKPGWIVIDGVPVRADDKEYKDKPAEKRPKPIKMPTVEDKSHDSAFNKPTNTQDYGFNAKPVQIEESYKIVDSKLVSSGTLFNGEKVSVNQDDINNFFQKNKKLK